jgi:hypothetical protein
MSKTQSLPAADREYLTDIQLAPKINIPVSTLRYWRVVGGGPPYSKLGRVIRYNLSSVLSWIDSRSHDGDSPSSALKSA